MKFISIDEPCRDMDGIETDVRSINSDFIKYLEKNEGDDLYDTRIIFKDGTFLDTHQSIKVLEARINEVKE